LNPKRKAVILGSLAFLATLGFVAANATYARRHLAILTHRLVPSEGRFLLRAHRLVSFPAVKQAILHLLTDERIREIRLYSIDHVNRKLRLEDTEFQKISDRHFWIPVKEDFQEWVMEFLPRKKDLSALNLRVVFNPDLRPSIILFQLASGLLMVLLLASTAIVLIKVFIFPRRPFSGDLRRVLFFYGGLLLVFSMYAAVHPGVYRNLFRRLDVRLWKVALFNMAAAVAIVLLYEIFKKNRLRLIWLPLLISLFFLPLLFRYKFPVCGDALIWISFIENPNLFFFSSEFLAMALSRMLYQGFQAIGLQISPSLSLVLPGKAAGVLYFFALYFLVESEKTWSNEKKVLFYLMALILPVNVFFLGYPEFAYHPLPFLLLAILFSEKYLSRPQARGYLALSAGCVAIAWLFHASAFVVIPALICLPVFKYVRDCSRVFFTTLHRAIDLGLIVLILACIIGIVVLINTKYTIFMGNIQGGGDRDMFVEFFQTSRLEKGGLILLEIGYLWHAGWIALTSVPFALFAFLPTLKRWQPNATKDFLIFLFAIPQVLLVLLWNHDLGFRDFDLYMAPLTLMNLLFVKAVAEATEERYGTSRSPLILGTLAATSAFFLILEMTTYSLF